MRLFYTFIIIYLKSFIRYKYSRIFFFIYLLSLILSYNKFNYTLYFIMLWSIVSKIYIKETLLPIQHSNYSIFIFLLKVIIVVPFLFLYIDIYIILYILAIFVIMFLDVNFIHKNTLSLKIDFFKNVYFKSFSLKYRFWILYISLILGTVYAFLSENSVSLILFISMITNYIYSSMYYFVNEYKSDLRLVFFHKDIFFSYLSKCIKKEIFFINVPFMVFVLMSDWYRLDVLLMLMINQYFSIKCYYYNYLNKENVFFNGIMIGIISIIPPFFVVQMINFILFEKRFRYDKYK